jgi:hypothetical protein
MSDEVRVWQVTQDDFLEEIQASVLDREERIEKWITRDVGVLQPDNSGLLVIGQQVVTDFGKEIDLLCIDSNGDIVIVELKRDKTPREVTSQALDYASWVKNLGVDKITDIAENYLPKGKSFKDSFEDAFGVDFPEVINEDHSINIVASEIDPSTERIIRYLSEKGVNINFIRFQMFRSSDGRELLIRTFTVPPDEAEQNIRRGGNSKRTSSKTLEVRVAECANIAEREFLENRLKDPAQQINNRRSRLLYRSGGRVRFRLSARKSHAYVEQKGRFADDERFWYEHLSEPELSPRRNGADLRFILHTKPDFDFFQHAMENDLATFKWSAALSGSDVDDDENE